MSVELNGVEVVDVFNGFRELSDFGQPGPISFLDYSRGAAPPVCGATHVAYSTTGGCSGSFASADNYRTMLGCLAGVVAGARDNLLSAEDSSFEGGTVGGWTDWKFTTPLTVYSGDAKHGSKCLKGIVDEANLNSSFTLIVTAVTAAGTQYTLSAWIKAGNAAAVGKAVKATLAGSTSGATAGTAVNLTTEWQQVSVTKTFAAGDAVRSVTIGYNGNIGAIGDIVLIDAIQLEAGATATPFCIDYADAATLSIPTATIGLGVGPTTYLVAFNAPWNGADGVLHTLFDCGSVKCYKSAANNLTLEITDGAAGTKTMAGAVTAVNMAKNTTHIISAKHDGAGTLGLKLNNTALTTAAGAGTGIPAAPNANLFIGTELDGTDPINAAAEMAVYGRQTSANEDSYLSKMTQWLPSLRSVC